MWWRWWLWREEEGGEGFGLAGMLESRHGMTDREVWMGSDQMVRRSRNVVSGHRNRAWW